MGKGELKDRRAYMALQSTNPNNPHVKQGAIIFKIPLTNDKKAQIEILSKQVFDWLVFLTEKMDNYQRAIDMVQNWLQNFIKSDIDRRPWVIQGAEMGGQKFLNEVNTSKLADGQTNVLKIGKIDLGGLLGGAFGNGGVL